MDGVPVKIRATSEAFRASFWRGAAVFGFSVVTPYRLPWLRVGELDARAPELENIISNQPGRNHHQPHRYTRETAI